MIQILAENLYKAVKAVKITEVSHLPVLNHARLKIDESTGYLTVTTTDLERPQTEKVSCRWDAPFETCVPMVHKCETNPNGCGETTTRKFYPFLDWLKVMAEYKEVLTMTLDEKTQITTVKAGNTRATFKCMDAGDYPPC